MPTDPTPLTPRERIERARAAAAARATQAAPVPASAPAATPAPTQAAPRAGGTSSGVMTDQHRLLWDIVRAAQLAGAKDLTRREIWRKWCEQSGKAQLNSTVSGRVAELLAMGQLHERHDQRMCSDSGRLVKPVYVPSHLLGGHGR